MSSSSLPNSSSKNIDNIIGLNKLFGFLIEEERDFSLNDYEKFLDKKLLKYRLLLKKKGGNSEEKILQMNNGALIVFKKDKKTFKELKIIRIDMETNQKEEIISQNIKNTLAINTIETKNKIIIKDNSGNEIFCRETDDNNPSFFEIKEYGFNYAIICESNNLHKILNNNSGSKLEKPKRFISIRMKIFLLLQISEGNFIISCDKGTYNYEDLILNISPEVLTEKRKISEKSFKKGANIDKSISIFFDNENQKGYLYKLINKNLECEPFEYPFILETMTVINCQENNIAHNIVLCAYKKNHKQYGIALIREIDDNIQICKKEFNFRIQFICPLKNIIKNNNNILFGKNNTKIVDTNYIIIVGEINEEIEMRIYKIKDLNNLYPNLEFITCLSCENIDTDLEGISFIIQSWQKGNLIIGNYNKETDYFYFEEND